MDKIIRKIIQFKLVYQFLFWFLFVGVFDNHFQNDKNEFNYINIVIFIFGFSAIEISINIFEQWFIRKQVKQIKEEEKRKYEEKKYKDSLK